MRRFIQDLSLNFHLFLDLFLYGGSSSSWQPPWTVSVAVLTQAIGYIIFSFHLMYLSKKVHEFERHKVTC